MFALIDWPSNLGLRPSGVERLPTELRRAGLADFLKARDAARIAPGTYDPWRSKETGLLNGPALSETARELSGAVSDVIRAHDIPIVLAGDCSVILGALLGTKRAMRATGRSDRVGLLFIDGHVDFYLPDASPTGEVADMDLALATGRGPAILAALDGPAPLVRDEDVVAAGARDALERDKADSQDIRTTAIKLFELPVIRQKGVDAVLADATRTLCRDEISCFWCHVDADVLDDEIMPAVDYRQFGGLTPEELTRLLKGAMATGRMAGVSLAIYNPALDPSGDGARTLVGILGRALGEWSVER